MRMLGLVLAAALLTGGCTASADGPPQIVLDRTACSRCGMLISEARHAAAYQAAGEEARVFDDIGCLRDAAQQAHGALRIWVHDASDGQWLNGDTAILVASPSIRTPMGGGMLAFRDPGAADRAVKEHRGRVVRSIRDIVRTEAGS